MNNFKTARLINNNFLDKLKETYENKYISTIKYLCFNHYEKILICILLLIFLIYRYNFKKNSDTEENEFFKKYKKYKEYKKKLKLKKKLNRLSNTNSNTKILHGNDNTYYYKSI